MVTEPPPDKPLIPKESAFNMIYGTLVGIALFVVIVILCWMLSTKLERDKQRKKREEIVSPFKILNEQTKIEQAKIDNFTTDKDRSFWNSDAHLESNRVRDQWFR